MNTKKLNEKIEKILEKKDLLEHKEEIHTLKNCNIFFAVLAVISIVCALIMVISTANALSSPYGF